MSLISTDPNNATRAADARSIVNAHRGTADGRRALVAPQTISGAHPHSVKFVGSVLERTLMRLLGPGAPLEPLLKNLLMRALDAWPTDNRPLLPWGQRLAVRAAQEYLKQLGGGPIEEWQTMRPNDGTSRATATVGRAREVLEHLRVWLRSSRPEEQLAFVLLELNGSSICEAAGLLDAPPAVVRQRAARVRRQLLFAARRDLWLTRYLLIAPRLRALLRCWDRATLNAPPSERTRHLSAGLELELTWFV
jgi:DNA-directed RNA polymerase specialized sigma24 family protein